MVKPGDNVVALHGQKEECPGAALRHGLRLEARDVEACFWCEAHDNLKGLRGFMMFSRRFKMFRVVLRWHFRVWSWLSC